MIAPAGARPESLALYVHVPFCEQKCAYCDFFTVTDPDRSHPLFDGWLALCLQEFRLWLAAYPAMATLPIATVFLGGGTPSLLPPAQYAAFLNELRADFGVSPGAEVSLETQPGTIAPADYAAYVAAGINRFSIGAQTFNPRLLQPTARRHTVSETVATIGHAQATGATVSVDMICALPGQTLDEWQADLARALEFRPHHLSVYEMTYHAGTQYFRQWRQGKLTETDEATRIAMFRHTRATLTAAGYHHYEVSNFARPGYESRHNRAYWTLDNFIGLGAGAHSYVEGHRFVNPRSADAYARSVRDGKLFARNTDSTDPDITLVENLQMPLRLLDGVNLNWLATRLKQDIRVTRADKLSALARRGWITLSQDSLKLTEDGLLQVDSISEFLL